MNVRRVLCRHTSHSPRRKVHAAAWPSCAGKRCAPTAVAASCHCREFRPPLQTLKRGLEGKSKAEVLAALKRLGVFVLHFVTVPSGQAVGREC